MTYPNYDPLIATYIMLGVVGLFFLIVLFEIIGQAYNEWREKNGRKNHKRKH